MFKHTLTAVAGVVTAAAALASLTPGEPAQAQPAQSQSAARGIRWRTGTSAAVPRSRAVLDDALRSLAGESRPAHFVVQFERPLRPVEREDARRAGLRLLSSLGSDAYFASARSSTLSLADLAGLPLVDVRAVERAWKLHPSLERDEVPTWAVVDDKDPAEPEVGVYVMFHPDVDLATDAQRVALKHRGLVRDSVETLNALVIELPFVEIKALAQEDEVQYIEPPLPKLSVVNDSNRARVGADTAQGAPYNLNGSGVTVLVYDAGTARATHQDFGGRATVRDSSGMHFHATHVAGTIGGSGAASGGAYRGMAPGVTIESYGFQWDSTNIFLYSNPGDFESDYTEAITVHGAAIANNSIGTNTETNGWPCSIQGDYGLMSSLIDAVVRGSASNGEPFRIIWAAGNERQGSSCDIEGYGDYYSTAPPAGAKNHITVGALNSENDSVTSFTSWGPTDDGRLKPDISGPGCQSNGDFGVTSPTSTNDTSYTTLCGTSMASPTVAGIGALMLEDYRVQFGAPDPRNSTLKVLLAHTAVDLGNAGPDYQTGYGSVRAVDAIDFMRSENFLEDAVDQGGVALYAVSVSGGEELRVTLAWDDYPATPNTATALVNDLDLHLFSPSGPEAFPWTLDPLNPSAAAVRTGRDHLNNIEQVYVAAPEAGVWRIEVRGTNVPQGPQDYSLAASPLLINCSEQGVLASDAGSYSCSSTVSLLVIDCGLNTDDGVVETVNVGISSTSEPGGETVLLTETGPETSAFAGSIPLATVDGAGVLLVAEGDSIDALYLDADNGQGGVNVPVMLAASVDCTAPQLVQSDVINIEPQRATVTLTADEPVAVTLHYGTNCGALNQQVVVAAASTSHSLQLANLQHGTNYFFDLELRDPAGNTTLDDNSGACHSFTTIDVPDYFTEQFVTNDMAFTTVTFYPNGSFQGYRGCSKAATAFPTNPAGGTTVVLSDDDTEQVVLAGGKTVSLYGVDYGSFYIGSNGYLTFGVGDTDYTESLEDHFDSPRISANFDDYNPSVGGSVSWKQLGNRVVVSYVNVPEYSTSNQNSFQIALFFDGRIQITYLGLASPDGVAGLSAGGGIPASFLPSDLSAYRCVIRNRQAQR